MATLTLATVRTNAYTEIFDALQTDNPITTNNIHSSYNNKQTIKEGYPQVIVHEPETMFKKRSMGGSSTNDQSIYWVPFTILIDVYDNTAAKAKTVADEVTDKLIGYKNTLRSSNIWNIQFEKDSVDVVEFHQDKSIHIYHITFSAVFAVSG